MDSDFRMILNALGKQITSLRGINRLPLEYKERIYASMVPFDLGEAYGVDPATLQDREGNKAFTFEFPENHGILKMQFKRSVSENDPIVFIQLSDTSYGQVNFEWVIINDPDSERFQIHKDDSTQFIPPGSEFRNIPEEVRAMKAGLAPGQVRRGLRKFREITDRVEAFLARLGIHMIHGDPYAYHNAIELERLGYFYASGREMMLEIDREFRSGGRLFKKLDGSTPFRQPGMEKTIRGRSWAIHDGIMDTPWFCPAMVRLVGRKSHDYTVQDVIYVPAEPSATSNLSSTVRYRDHGKQAG